MEEQAQSAKEEEGTKNGESVITITLLCMCACSVRKTPIPRRSQPSYANGVHTYQGLTP